VRRALVDRCVAPVDRNGIRQQEQESLDLEEREFLMQLSTVYTQRLEEATQQGNELAQKRFARNLLSNTISKKLIPFLKS
jgi:hypothetical protein